MDLNLEFQAGDCRFDFRQFRSGPHRKQPPMDVLGARRLRLSFLVLFLPQPQNNHHSHGQENRLEAIQNLPLLLSADNDDALAISLGEAIWGSICGAAHS